MGCQPRAGSGLQLLRRRLTNVAIWVGPYRSRSRRMGKIARRPLQHESVRFRHEFRRATAPRWQCGLGMARFGASTLCICASDLIGPRSAAPASDRRSTRKWRRHTRRVDRQLRRNAPFRRRHVGSRNSRARISRKPQIQAEEVQCGKAFWWRYGYLRCRSVPWPRAVPTRRSRRSSAKGCGCSASPAASATRRCSSAPGNTARCCRATRSAATRS